MVPNRIRSVSRAMPANVNQASVGPGRPSPPMAKKWSERKNPSKPADSEACAICSCCPYEAPCWGSTKMRSFIGSSYPERSAAGPGRQAAGLQRCGYRGQTAAMDIGVIFPQAEAGGDRGAVRAIGQAVADLGYTHLAAYDHVLGGDTAVLGDLGGPYTIDTTFREPLLMFAYLAGFTDLAFATSILIGPQRQTALLAKQAAELDLLCGGRFRLGLGIGWNKLEYDALGMPFEERAAVLEEQVVVLRALWTEWSVTIDGRYHHIRASGIAPPPLQRPIPIWIGGHAPAALRRVGRIADGWFPMVRPGGGLEAALEHIHEGAAEVGRDVSNLQFEGRLEYSVRDHDKIAEHARRWQAAGASHLSLNTMHADLPTTDAHIAALTEMAEILL